MISRACGNPVVNSAYWVILHAFLLSDDFFKSNFLKKKDSGIPSEFGF